KEEHQLRFSADKSAGANWTQIQKKLLANDRELLVKVSSMQERGMLIGIDQNGKLVFRDRGKEPVIYAFRNSRDRKKRELLTITTDISEAERTALMNEVRENRDCEFADYWEIRNAVLSSGFELPPNPKAFGRE